jgi:hypothetical protein
MPARSKILTLPPKVKEDLDRRLITGGFGDYSALAAWLADQGFEISRSSVHRYGQEFEERLAAIKIATEQAQAIAAASNDDAGVMGDALTRLCQEKAFQVLVKMQDPDPDNVDLNKVGIMIARLNRVSVAQKKWMAEAKAKAIVAANDVVKVARTGGLTEEKAEEIRRKILGIV